MANPAKRLTFYGEHMPEPFLEHVVAKVAISIHEY